MANERTRKAQDILERLSRLEQAQQDMMERRQADHTKQMDDLRSKLEEARMRCSQADREAEHTSEPLLMEVSMTEVEAAVQAASYAEQESAAALDEARKVAEKARLAAGGIPQAAREATKEGDVGYGADSEYIVKKVSVNLDEVERAISNSPYVNVCRAFGRPDAKYGNEVFCAVVPKKNVKVSEPMLCIHAQKYLTTAMVPKRFYFVEHLPPGITRKALAETHMSGELERKQYAEEPPAIENGQYEQVPAIEN